VREQIRGPHEIHELRIDDPAPARRETFGFDENQTDPGPADAGTNRRKKDEEQGFQVHGRTSQRKGAQHGPESQQPDRKGKPTK
jgi:hypothetical protein